MTEPSPSKRISMAPLPEFHDRMFTLWAWGKRRSRSALATHTIEARIEANLEGIRDLVSSAAKVRGITYEEMESLILVNPKYSWGEAEPKENDD